MPQSFDAIVLGARRTGLLCAIEAGKRGRRVALLDHAPRAGRKILISGGGRCNFTNLHCRPENFLSANPHFSKSALARYAPADFIRLVEAHRIPYHEKTLGQLFCDRSAHGITTMLERECAAAQVRIVLNASVREVLRDTAFTVRAGESEFRAPALVVATGGLSIPKLGATDLAYRLARQFGLAIEECRPALVPLLFAPEDLARFGSLAGVSTEVAVSHRNQTFREKMLFTHRGLSGPAILQISSYWREPDPIRIDLAPGATLTAPLLVPGAARTPAALRSAFRAALPARLADRWLDLHPPSGGSNAALAALETQAHRWPVSLLGTEGYAKAEVTAGGVSTSGLSAQTM